MNCRKITEFIKNDSFVQWLSINKMKSKWTPPPKTKQSSHANQNVNKAMKTEPIIKQSSNNLSYIIFAVWRTLNVSEMNMFSLFLFTQMEQCRHRQFIPVIRQWYSTTGLQNKTHCMIPTCSDKSPLCFTTQFKTLHAYHDKITTVLHSWVIRIHGHQGNVLNLFSTLLCSTQPATRPKRVIRTNRALWLAFQIQSKPMTHMNCTMNWHIKKTTWHTIADYK